MNYMQTYSSINSSKLEIKLHKATYIHTYRIPNTYDIHTI